MFPGGIEKQHWLKIWLKISGLLVWVLVTATKILNLNQRALLEITNTLGGR